MIAGSKSEHSIHLREVNDGSVDVQSAFTIPDDNLQDGAIFPVGHLELHKLPQVQTQLFQWLGPDIDFQNDRGKDKENKIFRSQYGSNVGKLAQSPVGSSM